MEEEKNKEFKDAIKEADLPKFPSTDEISKELKRVSNTSISHSPIQQGPYLVCRTCSNQHTIAWIGTDKMLTGVKENGEPILTIR